MTTAPTITDQTSAVLHEYIAVVFEPGDIVELRLLHKRTGEVKENWHPASEIPSHVSGLRKLNDLGFDIYCGVNPRKAIGGAKAGDVLLARVLVVDFDDVPLDEVRRRIDEAGLPTPTMLVRSGHGFHVYYKLESPLHDMDEWTAYQQGLIAELGSDSCIHDPPRIMRLPPFTNHSEDDPAICEIIESDSARQYSLDEFPRAAPRPSRTTRPNGKVSSRERENALRYLGQLKSERADPYDNWLSVGMALHSVDPDEAMLSQWDRWSRSSPKWQDGICAAKWQTFTANGSLRIATLHQMANEDSPGEQRKAPQRCNRVSESQQFAPFIPLGQADVPAMPDDLMPGWFGDRARGCGSYRSVGSDAGDDRPGRGGSELPTTICGIRPSGAC